MAQHSRRRKFRRYLRGELDDANVLGALGANTLTSATVGGSVVERTFVSSVKATWSINGLEAVQNDGPVTVGLSHSDYTDAEITEFIANAGSWNEGDKIAQEQGRRKIKIVGTFMNFGLAGAQIRTFVLNDGKPIHTKLNWILVTGQTLKIWAFNTGSSPLTSGALAQTIGHANLWPQ